MTKAGQKLTVGCPATYRIVVQGYFDKHWSGWFDDMAIVPQVDSEGTSITSLTGTVADQAALHGMLRKLYDLGLPILSIEPLDLSQSKEQGHDVTFS